MGSIPKHNVPPVAGIASITDPVARNQTINQSYHAFGREMAVYLGTPLVSNWCTYGQHASREAGQQIANLQAGLKILNDAVPILIGLASIPTNPIAAVGRAAARVGPTVRRILGLLDEEGLMQQSMQLALAKAGVGQGQIDGLEQAVKDATTFTWSDLIPGKTTVESAEVAARLVAIAVQLGININKIIAAVKLVYDNMVKGNREIYENIAPAYNKFLKRSQRQAPTGVVAKVPPFAGDTHGFLAAAFKLYSDARAIANSIAAGSAQASLVTRRERPRSRSEPAHRLSRAAGHPSADLRHHAARARSDERHDGPA